MGETKTCKDCGDSFEFTDGERIYFANEELSDPKRCPSCRAARNNIEDRQLKCQRCGKMFVYPKALQLYARSYKWDEPVTCIGGCGEKKFAEGYESSSFEDKASSVLGKISRFLGSNKSSPSKASPASETRTRITGFENTGVISNAEIKKFIVDKIPREHLQGVGRIAFNNDFFQIGDTGTFSRGFYLDKTILINKTIDLETSNRYKEAVSHEFGHSTYDCLSEDQQADWNSYSEARGPITDVAQRAWKNEEIRDCENFAEAYRLYQSNPLQLLGKAHEIYHFLEQQVFNGREYI